MGVFKVPLATTAERTGITPALGELIYDEDLDALYQGDGSTAGGVAVASAVVLDADDIDDTSTTNKFVTASDLTKLSNLSGTNTGDQNLSSYLTIAAAAAAYQPLNTVLTNTTASFTSSLETKLSGIESGAEVNDVSSVSGKTGDVTLVKGDVGLGNVDNTSDLNKPISTATQTALDAKVTGNVAITGATKTKITYDTKGLVTSGADATTADISDSTNRRYVTDAQLVVVGNTSGTNTGDQTSIVGITGTKAQFNTAVTDGDFLYTGDVTQYTDEMAQDAVGGILTDSATIDFTYTDGSNTITADVKTASVTNAMLSTVDTATFKGRTTAGTGAPEDLTAAQATAILNTFTTSLKGLAPASGGGTTNFLRADGTWAAPAGGGGGGASELNDLTDVTLTEPESGDILLHDGTDFKNSPELSDARDIYPALANHLVVLAKRANGRFCNPTIGHYYDNCQHGATRGTLSGSAGRIDLGPFTVPGILATDRVAISVSTGATGALGRIVIYEADETGFPSVLMHASGDLDFSSTGEKFSTVSLIFHPSRNYWAGIWHSSSAVVRAVATSNTFNLGLGTNASSTTYGTIVRRTITFAGGSAPDPWVFDAAEIVNNVAPPGVMVRPSSIL